MTRFLTGLIEAFEAEQDRWFLWVPVLLGLGIAIYFALPVEPDLPAAAVPALAAVVLAVLWRESGAALLVTSALLAGSLGFVLAKVRTEQVRGPVLARQIENVGVTGWIELVEPRPARGQRLTIRVAEMDRLAPDAWPVRIRVRTLKAAATPLKPGDTVLVHATLSPPAGPALPGGFDFARSAWFQGLGAVGYSRAAAVPVDFVTPPPWTLAWRTAIERVRSAINARITAALPGETGAIATALITGERGAITDATNDAYRDSGLFHILSISGLHMVIMAGSVFFSVRLLLSLVPWLALNFEIKKWAATAAAAGALAYLLISGASSPTVRSYVMISIMYLAVLLDRPAVALRNIALSALAIMVIWPESLIDVGFQMSYAAVVALVSAYEAIRERQRSGGTGARNIVLSSFFLLGGILLSTLIASLAVAPIAAYQFHKSQQYAMIANLVAIPICNILVMPAALVVLIALPAGLEAWPLYVMGLGIDAMTWIAVLVAKLPGAVGRIPAFATTAFALMVAGGLWLTLWQRRWRLLGLIPVAIGFAIAPWRDTPDILVGREGRLVAVRDKAGALQALGERSAMFDLERWLEHDGDGRPAATAASGRGFRCDWSGCTIEVRGSTLAVSRHAASLADDCIAAEIVLTVGRNRAGCGPFPDRPGSDASPRPLVIGGASLARNGPYAIRLRNGTRHIETVRDQRGERPWSSPTEADARSTATTRRRAGPGVPPSLGRTQPDPGSEPPVAPDYDQ